MSFAWKAPFDEVGRFLKGFRERLRVEFSDVVGDLEGTLARRQADRAAEELGKMVRRLGGVGEFLKWLEGDKFGTPLSRSSVQYLAEAYRVPALMLDPLFSESVDPSPYPLIESIDAFQNVNLDSPHYGHRAHYGIPQKKLSTDTDVAFGHLTLDPTGHSDYHDHTGTELLFLLDGTQAELRLETSGVRIPIRKNEFVHFRAEMPHSAHNLSETKASVFVIRFYQLCSDNTREQLIELADETVEALRAYVRMIPDLRKCVGAADLKGFDKLVEALPKVRKADHTIPFLRLAKFIQSLTTRATSAYLKELRAPKAAPMELQDQLGLALMLERIKGKDTYEDLAKRGKFSVTALHQILQLEKTVERKDLPDLARQFGVEPMLLYSFMFPSEPDVIAGRFEEMGEVPTDLTGEGVSYRVPRCNLALSDISLLMIDLDVGRSTKTNRHPGYELAIPLDESEIAVEYPADQECGDVAGEDTPRRVSAKQRQYAHYSSHRPHRLVNTGSKPARVFVVRFYG